MSLFSSSRFLLLAVVLVLFGCDALDYQPTGRNPVEKEPPPEPDPVVALSDSMAVWETRWIQLDMDTKGRELIDAWFVIDGEVHGEFQEAGYNRGPFIVFNSRGFSNGLLSYRLMAKLRATGDNLASEAGAVLEEVLAEGVFTIANYDTAPVVSSISASAVDGRTKIEWETPFGSDLPGFQYYEITPVQGYPHRSIDGIRIKDIATTSFVDSTFYDGTREFRVTVRRSGVRSKSRSARLTSRISDFEMETSGTSVRLKWTPAALYNTFPGYAIERRPGGDNDGWRRVATTSDGTVSEYEETLDVFGGTYAYRIRPIFPEGVNFPKWYGASDSSPVFSPPADSASWYVPLRTDYASGLDAFLVYDRRSYTDGELLLADRATKEIIQPLTKISSSEYRYSDIRPDGLRWYGVQRDSLVVDVYDTKTLQRTRRIDLSSFIPDRFTSIGRDLRATNGDVLFVSLTRYKSPTHYQNLGLLIVDISGDTPRRLALLDDWVSDEDIWRNGYIEVQNVSDEGGHLAVKVDRELRTYQISSDGITRLPHYIPGRYYTRDGTDYSIQFQLNDLDEPGVAWIYRLPEKTLVRKIEIAPGINRVELDPKTGLFGGIVELWEFSEEKGYRQFIYGPSTYVVYNLDGEVVRELPATSWTEYELKGGTLWTGKKYLDILPAAQ